MADKLAIQLREHKIIAGYNPNFTFSNPSAGTISISSTVASRGGGYCFISLPRTWLHGKTVEVTWAFTPGSLANFNARFYVVDGSYDRTSNTDFPTDAVYLSKGAGVFHTVVNTSTAFTSKTDSVVCNLSGGSQTEATIFVWLYDYTASYSGTLSITAINIKDSSGTLLSYGDIGTVVMEQTGTTGDYGLCGKTITWTDNYLVDRGRSRTRIGLGYSLGGGWDRNFQ